MTSTLRPNHERAKYAIALIWVVFAIEIVSLISGYLQYELLQQEYISASEADANDIREQYIGFFYLIAFFISAVTFIRWFRRAYFNIHQVSSILAYSESWAAWSWFIPIVCLYAPYRIMKDLYDEANELLVKINQKINFNLSTSMVGLWWALWIINNILGHIVFRLGRNADTIDSLINLTTFSMVSNTLGIVLALITIKVIRDYSEVESVLYENIEVEVKDPWAY